MSKKSEKNQATFVICINLLILFGQNFPKAVIVPYGFKKSGIEMSNKRLGLKSSWLKNLELKLVLIPLDRREILNTNSKY